MSQRHYVLVSLDVETPVASDEPASEKAAVARFVGALLRKAIFIEDVDAAVLATWALSPKEAAAAVLSEHQFQSLSATQAEALQSLITSLQGPNR